MFPEKWKSEVSIKPRTNSNLQAVLCGCHQMRVLQALVYVKAPLNAYPAANPVSAHHVQNTIKIFHLDSSICIN